MKSKLTLRETEVLKLIAEGYDHREIANKLNVSITTVASHKRNLMPKLKARNSAHAVMLGIQRKVI